MIYAQNHAVAILKAGKTVATNATNVDYVDGQGWNYATVLLIGGIASSGTSNTFSALALQESDDTATTNFANVTGAVGGTDATNGFTIPINNSSTTSYCVRFNVDLRKRKRYVALKSTPSIVASDMGPYSVIAVLSRGEEAPNSTLESIIGVGSGNTTTVSKVVTI